jgi:hypothetical protein
MVKGSIGTEAAKCARPPQTGGSALHPSLPPAPPSTVVYISPGDGNDAVALPNSRRHGLKRRQRLTAMSAPFLVIADSSKRELARHTEVAHVPQRENGKREPCMQRVKALLPLLVTAMVAACAVGDFFEGDHAPEPVPANANGLDYLRGEDLARIVRGHGLAWGHDSVGASHHRIVELFCRDGRWFHLGGAELLSGRYTFSDSALCVQSDMSTDNQSCREIRRDSSGRIFTIDLQATGDAPPYPVTSYDYADGERQLCGE